jgi:hypothetical protein
MRFNNVDQAQHSARRRVKSVYRFIEGGTDAEVTVAANRAAFGEVTFRRAPASCTPNLR